MHEWESLPLKQPKTVQPTFDLKSSPAVGYRSISSSNRGNRSAACFWPSWIARKKQFTTVLLYCIELMDIYKKKFSWSFLYKVASIKHLPTYRRVIWGVLVGPQSIVTVVSKSPSAFRFQMRLHKCKNEWDWQRHNINDPVASYRFIGGQSVGSEKLIMSFKRQLGDKVVHISESPCSKMLGHRFAR